MNAIDLSVSSLSISARTSGVNGFTRSSGPPIFCCMIHGPLSRRSLSGDVDGVGLHDQRDRHRIVPRGVRRNAIELVEAVRGWQALRVFADVAAEVPLAEDRGRVAGVLEQLPHGVGAAREGGRRVRETTSESPLRIEYGPSSARRATGCRRPPPDIA